MADMTVANEIRRQLGAKCLALLGAKDLVGDDRSLWFRIQGCRKYNKIRITLDPDDTYTAQFYRFGKTRDNPYALKAEHKISGLYVDQMHRVIEEQTGLCTS